MRPPHRLLAGCAAFALAAGVFLSLVAVPAHAAPVSAFTQIALIPVGPSPRVIAVNPMTNRIYTANLLDKTVSVIDGATNTVVATIATPVSTGVFHLAVNPTTNRIYVGGEGPGTTAIVVVIDGATNTIIKTIGGFSEIGHLLANPVTDRLYVQDLSAIKVLDTATDTLLPLTIPGPSLGPAAVGLRTWFALNPTTQRVYVQNVVGLEVFDALTGAWLRTLAGTPEGPIAVNPVTNRIYVIDHRADRYVVLDGVTDTIIADQPLRISLHPNFGVLAFVVNPVLNRVYLMLSSGQLLLVVDGTTNRFAITTFWLQGWGLDVNPSTGRLYNLSTSPSDVVEVVSDVPATPTPVVAELSPLTLFGSSLLALCLVVLRRRDPARVR